MYVLVAINVLWSISFIDAQWRLARKTTSIDLIAFLLSRWWVYAESLMQVALMVWLVQAMERGRAWAIKTMAMFQFSYIFAVIHSGFTYPIFQNSLILVYLLLRLSGGLGPTLRDSYLPAPEQGE